MAKSTRLKIIRIKSIYVHLLQNSKSVKSVSEIKKNQVINNLIILLNSGATHNQKYTHFSSASAVSSTFSVPTGNGSNVFPLTCPATTYTLLLRVCTCLETSCDTTCGH